MNHNGKLAKFMEKKIKEKDRVFIRCFEYKKEDRDADLVVVMDCQIPADDLIVHDL